MITATIFAACTVTATLLTLSRVVHWRKILGLATVVDVVFSLGLLAFLSGTLTGAMSAVLAGLLLAVTLTAGRAFFGYTSLTRSGWVDFPPAVRMPRFNLAALKPRVHSDWT